MEEQKIFGLYMYILNVLMKKIVKFYYFYFLFCEDWVEQSILIDLEVKSYQKKSIFNFLLIKFFY